MSPTHAISTPSGPTTSGSAAVEVELEVILPNLLRDSAGGEARLVMRATTLREALETLFSSFPTLKVHLYDEDGRLRTHVLVFYNGESIAWLDSLDVRLREGDQLQVINAVSGG